MQESVLGSTATDSPRSEERSRDGNGGGHRRTKNEGYRNCRARVIRSSLGDPSYAQGHWTELDGDERGDPPAVRGPVGQEPTESPRSLTICFPAPATIRG